MTSAATEFDHTTGSSVDGAQLALSRREAVSIVAFWTAYALLTLGNRIFEPGGGPPGSVGTRALIAATESVCWIVLTPILFHLATRVDQDATPGAGRRRPLVELIAAALVGAIVLAWVSTLMRSALMPEPFAGGPRGRGRGGHGPEGPRFWFGFVNAIVIALGVAAVALA